MVLLILLLGLLCSAGASAQTEALQAQAESIKIDAESISYDQKTDTVTATGDVVVRRGDTVLRAKRVEVQRGTSEAHAEGDVVLHGAEGVLTARQVDLDLENETGSIVDGSVYSPQYGYSLSGERIEKGLGQRYRIENGKFTTCNCGEGAPSWSIAGEKVNIDLNGYGRLEGGTFNVLDYPIFYLPRAVFPVTRERQTGFLLPRFGASNRRGFQLIQPFYLAINRSHDLTAALDVETGARLGMLGEYRYALSPETAGTLSASYFNEIFRSAADRQKIGTTVPENRWSVVGEHTQGLPDDTVGYVDLFLVSDDLFLREINTFSVDYRHDVLDRTRRYTDSRVGALHTWDRAALQVEGQYYQDLIGSQSLTLQRVPELHFWGQSSLGSLAFGSVDLSATSFQRQSGIDGFRFDVKPGVTVPLRTSLPIRAALNLAVRETAYSLTQRRMRGGLDPDSQAQWVLELPGQVSRETAQLGAEAGTEFSRVYRVGGTQLQRLKHTIEPVISYEYVPAVAQNDLPLFDSIDRVDRRNLVTYGIVSRLLGKYAGAAGEPSGAGAPSVRELGSLSLLQSYDFERQIAPVGQPPGGPKGDHFSDIDLAVRANPSRSTSVLARTSYDGSAGDISAAAVAVRLADPRARDEHRPRQLESRSNATIGYRFITQGILQQVDGSLLLHLTDYLGFLFASRYDVQNQQLLETHFGLRLLSRCDCWGLDLAVTDKTNPSEVEVRAQLTLVGLGSSPGGSGLP